MTARHELDTRHVGPHVARVVTLIARHVPSIAHVAADFARFDAEVPRSGSPTSPAHVALARHAPGGRRVVADLAQVEPDVSYVESSSARLTVIKAFAGARPYFALAPCWTLPKYLGANVRKSALSLGRTLRPRDRRTRRSHCSASHRRTSRVAACLPTSTASVVPSTPTGPR